MLVRMNCLNTEVSVSFFCPKFVPARVRKALSFLFTLVMMFCIWEENVMCGSKVRPRMVGVRLRGSRLLYSLTLGCVWDSLVCEVRRVTVDF